MQRAAILLSGLLLSTMALAQYAPPDPSGFQGLVLERYYVADANDAADTDGGAGLLQGATTYRVFVDLKPGYKLLTVGGFQGHALNMGTSTTLFNNEDRGEAWGYAINDIHLDKNTVAVDSWLTIGGASDAHWGVPKSLDPDGSIVGGVNNDGGSNSVPEGLLVNNDATAGIPLTTADGLWNAGVAVPQVNALGTPPDLFDPGGGNAYTSENYAWAVLGGTTAPDTANRILIGQFTTDGVLSMCLNLFVKLPDSLVCDDPECHDFMIFYANLLPTDTSSTTITDDHIFTHPSLCLTSESAEVDCEGVAGGTALPGTPCDDGNADTQNDAYAANCDCLGEDCEGTPGGPALPGTPCDDGNAATSNDVWASGCVCEGSVGIVEHTANTVLIAPNPVRDQLRIRVDGAEGARISYELIDAVGTRLAAQDLGLRSSGWNGIIDMGAYPQGLYYLDIRVGEQRQVERIVKL